MLVRNITDNDLPFILQLNNSNIPAVSELDLVALRNLYQQSKSAWLIEDSNNEAIAGFCLIIPPNVNYGSANYRWVSERYSNFQYLDRIVISESFRGRGLGRKLYEHWFSRSNDDEPLLLEVNIKPRNSGSLVFHDKLGFTAVGEQDTEGGKKRVQYMARNIEPGQ